MTVEIVRPHTPRSPTPRSRMYTTFTLPPSLCPVTLLTITCTQVLWFIVRVTRSRVPCVTTRPVTRVLHFNDFNHSSHCKERGDLAEGLCCLATARRTGHPSSSSSFNDIGLYNDTRQVRVITLPPYWTVHSHKTFRWCSSTRWCSHIRDQVQNSALSEDLLGSPRPNRLTDWVCLSLVVDTSGRLYVDFIHSSGDICSD
jgi:hypothetical protein